jgi:amidase
LLGVIADDDRLDPLQGAMPTQDYTDALDGTSEDVTIGVVEDRQTEHY